AGTVVIRERVPKSTAAPAVMPPHLAGWAATLPVSRLPDTLALEARQVVSRLEELEPEIGESLSRQLAEEVLAALGTTAPGETDPVAVLSAVLAERRARDLARAGMSPPQGATTWGPPAVPGWGAPQATWGAAPAAPQQPPTPAPPEPAPRPEQPPPGPFASPG
ncbi:MAG TPA: hypothetical protein VMZ00_11680, partial [Sporichthya sp.]|nr:hypothetical protein [Sporichthya sp.]